MKLKRALSLLLLLGMFSVYTGCASTSERESTGAYIDDAAITAKVKAAIFREPDLKSTQVNVETKEGIVQLSGFVNSDQSSKRAAEVARTVEGVKDVRNNIIVKP
jgi:osmotically-inducible protein OsmY